MIVVLSAEESLRKVTEVAAGNGLIKKPDRDRIMNAWRRDTRKNTHTKNTLDKLLSPGIGFVEVRKNG